MVAEYARALRALTAEPEFTSVGAPWCSVYADGRVCGHGAEAHYEQSDYWGRIRAVCVLCWCEGRAAHAGTVTDARSGYLGGV